MRRHSHRDPLDWIEGELDALRAHGLHRGLVSHAGAQRARLDVDGQRLINFGSNDYLALAADLRLAAAAASAMRDEGWGAGASPLVTGHASAHAQLERRLADFEDCEAALVFSSGYAANTGTIPALVERGDAIFADQRNHASMIDGCRLSRAAVHVYPHCDADALESLLRQANAYRRRLILTESVFSMGGDLAPLVQLAELAERYECMLMFDEAHATGVFGTYGRGLAEQLDVERGIHVRIGTLSKALGSAGGFVCGSRLLVEWLVNKARPYIFSTALPPSTSAAAVAALGIVRDEPARRVELLQRAGRLRQRLCEQGWNLGTSDSQIVPLIVGEPQECVRLSSALRQQGLLVPAIRPPSVPRGESLLRISLTSGHSEEMIEQLVQALASARTVDVAKQPTG